MIHFLPLLAALLVPARALESGAPAVRAVEKASAVSAARPRAPAVPKGFLPLPLVEQETDYSCGPASLLSVLRYWQVFEGAERDLYGPLDTTPKDGTEPQKLVEVAARYGLSAEMREGMSVSDLSAALKRGDTVIVDFQAWREEGVPRLPWEEVWEDGHYSVLAAMAAKNAYFMDPVAEGAYAYMPLDELPKRWHDYEDRHGTVNRSFQLGVIIRGKTPIEAPSKPPSRPIRLK